MSGGVDNDAGRIVIMIVIIRILINSIPSFSPAHSSLSGGKAAKRATKIRIKPG